MKSPITGLLLLVVTATLCSAASNVQLTRKTVRLTVIFVPYTSSSKLSRENYFCDLAKNQSFMDKFQWLYPLFAHASMS